MRVGCWAPLAFRLALPRPCWPSQPSSSATAICCSPAFKASAQANIVELLGGDPPQLSLCEGQNETQEGPRARDCLRFAQMLDLVVEDERRWKPTASGITYAENVDRSNPWIANGIQAEVLRDRLAGDAPLAGDARIALQVVRDLPAGFFNDDLGRALAEHANTDQWQADQTSNRKVLATENSL